MSTLELLDAAWLVVRRNWVNLYAASGVGTAPLALMTITYFVWLGRLVRGTGNEVFYQGTLAWAVGMALAWTLNSLARAAGTRIILADARAEPLSLGAAWRGVLKVAPSAAFVGLFSFAAAGVGALAIVPGALLACTWWVARPALLTEGQPFMGALRRGARLTAGYRGKAFGVWLLLVLVWIIGFFNLHLLCRMLLETVAGTLGVDTTGLQPYLNFRNQAYVTFLLAVMFVLLDPLKTALDALLYLDLRIRREGADLQERLRALRAGAAVLLLGLCLGSPARAMPLDEYRAKVRALREQVAAARKPEQVDLRGVRSQVVQDGDQKITVENDWATSWSKPEEKQALLSRLEALERSLGGGSAPTATPQAAPASAVDPKTALKEILAEPEFQPLAERTELRDLGKSLSLKNTESWWKSFTEWLRKTLFKPSAPPRPRVQAPNVKAPDLSGWMGVLRWVAIALAAIVVLIILALLVRWFLERGPAEPRTAAAPGEAPPLEASATENALDHTVDDWELFARQWLGRGDVRQAIRALYLATLVHLHRERRIEYNRAFTNWTYVRQFRGEAEQKSVLRRLTQVFDEIWYGDRDCGEEQYRQFEQGVRTLGTPAPQVEPARG